MYVNIRVALIQYQKCQTAKMLIFEFKSKQAYIRNLRHKHERNEIVMNVKHFSNSNLYMNLKGKGKRPY